MLYHFVYNQTKDVAPTIGWASALTRSGYLGVDVFFMISGFVVLWSARGRSAREFVRARLLRLYPEFWIAVVLAFAVFRLVPGGFGDALTPSDLLRNLSMVPQYLGAPYVDGVYWTLGAELKFYALLWLLLLLRQVQHLEWWLHGWLAASLVASFVDVGPVVTSLIVHPWGTLFACGGLFFLVHDSGWSWPRIVSLSVGFPLAARHALAGIPDFVGAAHITPAARVFTVAVIAGAFLTFALLRHVRLPERVARHAALAGALTYPLYLLHDTGKELFLETGTWAPHPLRILLAIAWSLGISWVVMRVAATTVLPAFRIFLDRLIPRPTR